MNRFEAFEAVYNDSYMGDDRVDAIAITDNMTSLRCYAHNRRTKLSQKKLEIEDNSINTRSSLSEVNWKDIKFDQWHELGNLKEMNQLEIPYSGVISAISENESSTLISRMIADI